MIPMNCRKKYRSSFAILVVEPEIYGQRLIPLDQGCIIREPCNIGSRADSGKERVLYIEFLREGNIDVIGTLERCLKVIITKGRNIRHGIISPFKCQCPDIAGKRGSGLVEPAGRTIP